MGMATVSVVVAAARYPVRVAWAVAQGGLQETLLK